jgi:transposase
MSEVRVRYWIKQFLESGFEALPDRPHVGQSSSVTSVMIEALRQEMETGERTWSAPQIARWLTERFGVSVSADWLSRRLKRERLSYKRTSRSLKHKRDPHAVELKRKELQTLEKGGPKG